MIYEMHNTKFATFAKMREGRIWTYSLHGMRASASAASSLRCWSGQTGIEWRHACIFRCRENKFGRFSYTLCFQSTFSHKNVRHAINQSKKWHVLSCIRSSHSHASCPARRQHPISVSNDITFQYNRISFHSVCVDVRSGGARCDHEEEQN